jgi:hypothetical protein
MGDGPEGPFSWGTGVLGESGPVTWDFGDVAALLRLAGFAKLNVTGCLDRISSLRVGLRVWARRACLAHPAEEA